jgi:hypothetical protein
MHCLSLRFRMSPRYRHSGNWLSKIEMRARLLLPHRYQLSKIVPLPFWYLQCLANSHLVKWLHDMQPWQLLSSRL